MSDRIVTPEQYRQMARAPKVRSRPPRAPEIDRRELTRFDLVEPVELRLPFPPSVNNYWRSAIVQNHVQVYIGERGREYRDAVISAWHTAQGLHGFGAERLAVRITAVLPDRRGRDLDNLCKATLDSLSHAGAWRDDEQVKLLIVENDTVEPPGWLKVRIGPKPGVARQGNLFDLEF